MRSDGVGSRDTRRRGWKPVSVGGKKPKVTIVAVMRKMITISSSP
jgi:hypothetical protein